MTYRWNFRSTAGFVTDVSPEVFIPGTQAYSAGVQPGWIGGTPTVQDDNTAYGSRAAGYETIVNSTGRYFAAPVAPGAYKIDMCAGVVFANQRCAINIFDGFCGDTQNRDFAVWQTGSLFGPGTYCMHGPNLYARVSGGTAGTAPPVHTSGDTSDGGIVWRFVKAAVWSLDTGTPANRFVDANGAAHAPADWQLNAQLSNDIITLGAGFITVARRLSLVNCIRHLGLVLQSPSNTGLPVISGEPVVGETLSVSTGVWSGSPTSYSYQWRRSGTAITGATESTYTVADADAAFPVVQLDCQVTANNAAGSATATAVGVDCRRTYPTLTYPIGRLTRQGMGGVTINNIPGLIGASASFPTNWTKNAFSSNDGNWNRSISGVTPVPASHGSANAASYSATWRAEFADRKQEDVSVTIATRASTYTVSERDDEGIFVINVGVATLSGKTVEFAVGANYVNDQVLFQCMATSTVVLRNADPDRAPIFSCFRVQNASNIQVGDFGQAGIHVGGPIVTSSVSGRFTLNGVSTIRVLNPICRGDQSLIEMSYDNKHDFFGIANCQNVVIEDADGEIVGNYISISPSSASSVTSRRAKIRYHYSNGIVFGGIGTKGSTVVSEDDVMMAARRPDYSADHMDGIQLLNDADNNSLSVRRLMVLEADGNAACQGVWNGHTVTYGTNHIDLDGVLYVGRYGNGIGIGSSDNNVVKRLTVMKSGTGSVAPNPPSTEPNVDQPVTYGPWVLLALPDSEHAGTNTLSRVISQDGLSLNYSFTGGTWTYSDGIHDLGGNAVSGTLPSGTPVDGFAETNPHDVIQALEDDGWTATFDEIVSAYRQAFRPLDGGAFERGDGSFDGALNPDGSWATDAAYVP